LTVRFFATGALTVLALCACRPAPPDPVPGAKRACQDFVAERLVVPSSAKFPEAAGMSALEGRPRNGVSPAAQAAATLAQGLADPAAGAKLITLQIKFLEDNELSRIESLAKSGKADDVRGIVGSALARRFGQADYVISGYVDAQDRSGTATRTNFICLVNADGGKNWKQVGVALGY
jgi:hypothetical protein